MNLKANRTYVSSAILWLYSSFTLFVLGYMTYQAFRSKKELLSNTFGWPDVFNFANFGKLFAEAGFHRYFFNSVLILAVTLLIVIALSSMVAYGIGRFRFRFKNGLLVYFLIGLMFPVQLGIVPIFLLIRDMGLMNSQWGVVIVLASGLSMPVFLLTTFFEKLPADLYESAKIDGAGDFMIFRKLILPMTTPALATIGLFIALGYWNEWYNAMLFLTSDVEYRPLQLFLYNVITRADFIRNSSAASNVPLRDMPLESMKMATAIVATGPVILFYPFVQRYFIKGLTVGAVKG